MDSGHWTLDIGRLTRRRIYALALLALSWPVVAWGAAKLLIQRAPLERADAIVLLSGSSVLKERAAHAAELYRAGRSAKIILTNDGFRGSWSNVEQRNPFYYESTLSELTRAGVPRDAIEVLMPQVSSTQDEALLLRKHAEEKSLQTVLVVTSAYHSRRALFTFRHVFRGTNIRIGMDPAETGWQTPAPATWWLHLRGWRSVPLEYSKIIYYRLIYW